MAEVMIPSEVVSQEVPEGGSGVKFFGGSLFRNEDYNADLVGQKGCQVYEEMRRGDPDVSSGLANLLQPLKSKNLTIPPAEDTDEEREIADFCAKWILGEGRTDPFCMTKEAFLNHAFICVSDGMSAFEKVWGRDQDGRDVYADLVPVLPKTIERFVFSDVPGGGLDHALQRAFVLGKGFTEAKIRADKLALFVFGQEGQNLFGWPILRAAYKPWFQKDQLELIDCIRLERNGIGFMVITVPRASAQNVRDKGKMVMTEARANERTGALVEEGTTIEISYPSGTDPKILDSINLRRTQILATLGSEFIEHGSEAVGSKALVTSKIDLMLLKLQGLGASVCETINRQLINPLVYANWGKRKKYPKAQFEDLARLTALDLAEFVSKLAPETVGGLPIDPELLQEIRRSAHLPAIPESDMKLLREIHDARMKSKLEMAKNPPELSLANPNAVGAPNGQPTNGQKPKLDAPEKLKQAEAVSAEPKPAMLWREPFQHELHADFPRMKAYLQSEPSRIWKTLVEPFRDRMADVAARRLVEMSDADFKKGRVAFPWQKRLSQELEKPVMDAYTRGRKSVLAEKARQQEGVLAADSPDDSDEYDVTPTREDSSWGKELAAGFVVAMLAMMEKRAFEEARTIRQSSQLSSLPAADQRRQISDAMRGLSENVLQVDLASAVNRAFQTGRETQAKVLAPEIETCYFTAIMDDGTDKCAESGGLCAQLDGDEFEFGDSHYETPSPLCSWPPNCRCTQVYIFKRGDQAA